jgi:hypothetical protein
MAPPQGVPQVPDSLADFQFQTLEALDHCHFVAFIEIFAAIAIVTHLFLVDMFFEEKTEPHSETILHIIILQIKFSLIICRNIIEFF